MKKLNSLYRALYKVKLVRCLFLCKKLIKSPKAKSSYKQAVKVILVMLAVGFNRPQAKSSFKPMESILMKWELERFNRPQAKSSFKQPHSIMKMIKY